MKVLVTGGTGFIGSHTVVELQKKDFDVIIVDNLSNSYETVIDNIEKITNKRPEFKQIDLSLKEETDSFFKENRSIDAIIHFAASKAVGESVKKPLEYYRNNINSLLNILDNMAIHNIKYFVFSSSCTVYGQPDKLPVDESSPIKAPLSPYGNTKQICEEIIHDFTLQNKNIKATLLRYFNPIGAHETSFIGELPIGIPNNLIPYITQTAIGIREQLSIFGADYNTPDGTAIRDYIHVVDLAQAHIAALTKIIYGQNNKNPEIFNIGTGKGYSVLEILKTFEKVTKVKLNYKITERRAGDIEQVWADTSYANKALNWKAEKTLEDMLLSAWNWEKHLYNQK